MAWFGKKGKEAKGKVAPSGGLSFNRVQVVSKPEILEKLLKGIKEEVVETDVARDKLKAASLVSGRGRGSIYTYIMYNFKKGPRPVVTVSFPRSQTGGNFVPADNPLEPGESIEFTYSMSLPEADGNTLYFSGRGAYLQTAIYIPNPEDANKPWIASREITEKKKGAGALKQGEEVLQVRVDQLTVYPHGPESFTNDQFGPYIFAPKLYVLAGGGVWAKRGGVGYFEGIPDDLSKYLDKVEEMKTISGITLVEFGVDQITMLVNERLLYGIEQDSLLPSVLKKPNDHLQQINSGLGFLLKFEVADGVKELIMRTFPQKVGKEVEIYLPLTLGFLTEAEPPKERVVFQVFPRDLIVEINPARRKTALGLKFVPPFTLHPNAEDQNTYRKLMVAIGQRIKDDARPEEERNKLASVQAQVMQRREQTKGKYVDEKMKKAFQSRQEARKRKDQA